MLYWPVVQFLIIFLLIFISITPTECYNNQYNDQNLTVYKDYLKNVHTNSVSKIISCRNCSHQHQILKREIIDTTFLGHPKTKQERWHAAFKTDASEKSIKEASSLVDLLIKVAGEYLDACIPIVLYDVHVEQSSGNILEIFFKNFKTTYLHGKISENFTILNKNLLKPNDSRCRSYVLFLSDVKRTRDVLGPQTTNRVVVIPLSSQWKLQEFLSSKLSSDIVNLLLISKSVSAGIDKSDVFVLYTHRLFTDGLGSNKPMVLTSWINGKLSRPNVNLFPTKLLRGFAGHRFEISSIHQPPYVVKKLSTDAGGNVAIEWDGLEFRILKLLARRLDFTYDISEPPDDNILGPTFGVAEEIALNRADIGVAGAYVTIERLGMVEMSVQHSKDCAVFITLASKSLPRYRAIMGPFQWPVWLAIVIIYIVAIFPLAFSDRLTLKHLIGNWSEMENMFWYVFGTFTNSLTFSGKFSWSKTKRNSTRILIGWYWVFTIIITACYTGSIIAFVTLPVVPETVDTISDLLWGFYRIGTLSNDGWQYWFTNSSHAGTLKLLKNLEFVANIEEGLSNVTKAFFWPYAFLGSHSRLEFIVEANFSDDALGKTTALHISDTCLSIFGISYLFSLNNVYINRFDNMILRLQQSGLISKINNEMEWERQRSSKGKLLKISPGSKSLKSAVFEDRKLALADTEGMFLLMGIGYAIAFSVLVSEIIGGCAKKCRTFMRRTSKLSSASAVSTNRPNSTQIQADIITDDGQSSGNSFEITTKMLHRKSIQSDSVLNPFKSYYMRHRRHHSLVASETERQHNLYDNVQKRYSLEENNSGSLCDINESGDMTTFEVVHQVEINRIQTPYIDKCNDSDNDDNCIDKAMGEKVYHTLSE